MITSLRALVWAGVVLGAAVFVVNAGDMVRIDVPGDYVEGVVLDAQVGLQSGHSPYDRAAWQEPPYRIHLYGPVVYQVGAWALAVAGGRPSLQPGRVISLLSLALALSMVWLLARRLLGLSRSSSLLAALLPCAALPVAVFAPQNRVDTPAAALSLVGVALAALGGRVGVALAGVPFVLAVFAKPTSVAAPAAVLLWLVLARRFRDAAVLAGSCVVLGTTWLVALHVTTGGAFAAAVFSFNAANPFALGGLVKALQVALAAAALPMAAAVALASLTSERRGEAVLALYLLLATGLAVATVGKVGANVNYFLEASIAMAPLLALAWERHARQLLGAAIAAMVVATMLVQTVPRLGWEVRGRRARAAVEPRIEGLLSGTTALTMEVASALRAGATPYVNDPYIFTCLAGKRRWDESRLVADLDAAAIPVVLADADMSVPSPEFSNWSPAVRAAVTRRYTRVETLGPNLIVYRPSAVAGGAR